MNEKCQWCLTSHGIQFCKRRADKLPPVKPSLLLDVLSIGDLWDLYYFHEEELEPGEWLAVESELASRSFEKAPLELRGCHHAIVVTATPET